MNNLISEENQRKTEARSTLNLDNLPKAMRWLGGIILSTAALTFIIQGWNDLNSVERYYSFVQFSFVMTLCGIFCGVKVKEDKGARTFLGLATAMVPALFCQLGAMVLSASSKVSSEIPNLFKVSASSNFELFSAIAVGLVVTPLICYFGFSSLAREQAKNLTLAFLLSNLLLLIPSRESNVIATLVCALTFLVIAFDNLVLSKAATIKTWEGKAARFMLFVPALIMVARNLVLYETGTFFFGVILVCLSLLSFFRTALYTQNTNTIQRVQALSACSFGLGWYYISCATQANSEFIIPFIALPIFIAIQILSLIAISGGKKYRTNSSIFVTVAIIFQLFTVDGYINSLICILVAAAVLIIGVIEKNKLNFKLGVVGLAAGIFYHLSYAIDLYKISPWLSLGLAGGIIVIASSYIERNREMIKRVVNIKDEIKAWN